MCGAILSLTDGNLDDALDCLQNIYIVVASNLFILVFLSIACD